MTDRHAGYYVVLAEDIREDDAEHIINAISMIKGVLTVIPQAAKPFEHAMARERRDSLWRRSLRELAAGGPSGE